MPDTRLDAFACPHCGAKYKLVRMRQTQPVAQLTLSCRVCHNPLPGTEGGDILKYFLTDRRSRTVRTSGAIPAAS
jgi:hypothetical protein